MSCENLVDGMVPHLLPGFSEKPLVIRSDPLLTSERKVSFELALQIGFEDFSRDLRCHDISLREVTGADPPGEMTQTDMRSMRFVPSQDKTQSARDLTPSVGYADVQESAHDEARPPGVAFMNRAWISMIVYLAACLFLGTSIAWAAEPSFDRKEDVIYGRKYGTALTMDVFTPKKDAKGIGVVFVVSGGFFSSHEAINPSFIRPFIDRGFTVFAVVHGSQPRFTVPEIIQDMNRAVRFIRHHAKDYGIDPDRIGVYGGSAGGHLSLMLGMAGDKGDPNAKDPVDRESSRVQAVACFFPPTDLLNFGKPGKEMIHATDHQPPFRAAFDYRELDKKSMLWLPITDDQRLRDITRQISPITFVTPDDPPTLIIHGDGDTLVPLQQSEVIVEKFKKTGVEAKLVVKKGAGHGWVGSGQRPDPIRRLVRSASQEAKQGVLTSHTQLDPARRIDRRQDTADSGKGFSCRGPHGVPHPPKRHEGNRRNAVGLVCTDASGFAGL